MTGGIPALALALLQALLAELEDRSTGRTGQVDIDDLHAAFGHRLYSPRVWSRCLSTLPSDSGAHAAFAAVRCAVGSAPGSRVPVDDVAEWAAMRDMDGATTDAALDRLETLGLVRLERTSVPPMVVLRRSGLALVAAREQGAPERVLE